ncbi:MAG: hypothetical protein RI997_369, partial [Pseudomonadota bacterium]
CTGSRPQGTSKNDSCSKKACRQKTCGKKGRCTKGESCEKDLRPADIKPVALWRSLLEKGMDNLVPRTNAELLCNTGIDLENGDHRLTR